MAEQIPSEETLAPSQFEVLASDVESQVEKSESNGEKSQFEKEKSEAAAKALEKIQSTEVAAANNEKAEAKALTLKEKKEMLVKKFAEIVTVARDPVAVAEEIFNKARTKYLAKYPDMVKDMYIEIMDRLDKAYESGRGRASG